MSVSVLILLCVFVVGGAYFLYHLLNRPNLEAIHEIYARGPVEVSRPVGVYHLGHSLVGKDMPLMLQQIAGKGHEFRSQQGWGTQLQAHWEPDKPINGYKEENDHPYFQEVFSAIDSGEFNVFVLTESVEIRDAIKYHDSERYLANFARRINESNPDARIYLYESWHEVTDKEGWINRLDRDLDKYWIGQILNPALARLDYEIPVYVIPVGQVLSAIFKEIKSRGGVGDLTAPSDIFARKEDGSLDPIHPNAWGNFIVAMVHHAVIYHSLPDSIPSELQRADGTMMKLPSESTIELIKKLTWETVSNDPRTGVNAANR